MGTIRRGLGVVIAATLTTAALATTPAGAISYGESDGDAHANVGALLIRLPGENLKICSGTLVAPTVFLTAAHCFFGFEALPFAVTFDPVVSSSSTIYRGRPLVHP